MPDRASDAHAAGFGLTDVELSVHPMTFATGLLTGQVAVISGGAGGIGRAIAWLFARMGAVVVITGRKSDKIAALVDAMTGAGHAARGEVLDIRDRPAVDAFWDRVFAAGGADHLINSAGGQFPAPALDFTPRGWEAVISTNLNGTFHMMQAAARHWRDHRRAGNIVNIVVVTTGGLHGVAHTVAARAGVIALSRAVAVEWAPLNIRINCVAPGAIETEGWAIYTPEVRASYPKTNPMMRVGSAWDIAEACGYLSAPSGRFITGDLLTLDGGGQHWGETWTTTKPAYFRDVGRDAD